MVIIMTTPIGDDLDHHRLPLEDTTLEDTTLEAVTILVAVTIPAVADIMGIMMID